MSVIKLLQVISADKLSNLKAHMGLYGLSALAPLLDNADATGAVAGYTIALGNNFLNTENTISCGLINNAGSDFLFWLTVKTGVNKFADYFPEILPADPWLAPDPETMPFPNLAAAAVDDLEWRYLFFSTSTQTTQEALYSSYSDALKPDLDKLLEISGTEHAFNDSIIAWVGGFYYSGSYNFPWALLIPADIPWNSLVPAIGAVAINGCIFQQEAFSYLKLRVPLLTKADPFGSGIIKNIAFAFELSTILSAENETTTNSVSSLNVGLSGTIEIGDTTEISVTGTWPLIGDDIIIDATCKLSQINAYFDNTSIAGVTLPDSITADISFYLSKATFSITKINFGLDIESWAIAPGIFELQSVAFDITLISPADANIVLASFGANAKIGGIVSVICSGNYPDGNFSIGLDPATHLKLGELVNSISGIPDIFPDGLLLNELSGSYNSDNKFYSLAAAASDDLPWEPGNTGFTLKGISANVSKGADFNCSLVAVFEIDFTGANGSSKSMLFNVSAIYSASWYFSAGYTGNVSIADVAAAFGFSDIPDFLNGCVFTAISLIFDSGSGYKQLSGNVTVTIDDNANVDLALQMNLLTVNGATTVNFSGDFTLRIDGKDLDFHVDFNKQADGSYDLQFSFLFKITNSVTLKLDAESKSTGGSEKVSEKFFSGSATGLNVSLTDALNNLIENMAGISLPVELPDLILTGVACAYDGKNSATNLIATGTIGNKAINFVFYYGKAVAPAAGTPITASRYAFGLQTDMPGLESLPIVGPQLKDVNITNFGFVYTSEEGEYSMPALQTGPDASAAPASQGQPKTLNKGFNFTGEIQLPGEANPFSLTLPTVPADPAAATPAAPNSTAATSTVQDATKWFKLDKKLGPVTVGQVGFKFADGSLELLISGSLTIASLTLTLNGLGVSFNVAELFKEHINPKFSLAGIGLQYSAPPVEISGAFLHSVDPKGIDVYSGAAIIKASKFTITALGSYANIPANSTDTNNTTAKTSLFIYGLYEGAIGGPIFFFVTGIAAGFGYNRKVNVPSITEVDSFPLVSLAMSPEDKSLEDILASLDLPMLNGKTPIEISLGDYWLAVGVKFTSFKIIESFVLVTVNFGTQLEFAILGLSKLSWPEKSIMPDPIVYIELAILAHFGPDSDVISVEAIITSNSYLLSKDCKLTGGFAFYSWVSGPHEGDFVVTLGGYHPKFIKPDYYPTVPRLGLSWKVSDVLMISGEIYYAITPSAIMAGGKWDVLFQIPVLTVNVTVWADMLIYWSPFQYYIDVGICVKIDANINVAFICIHFSLEMDAELHIWGPPFAGEAYVDWTIFSFTIPFGDGDKKDPDPLPWQQFSDGFVPHNKPAAVAATALNSLADTPAVDGVADPINIMISNGIIDVKTGVKGQDNFAVINPYQLVITVDSFIPVTTLTLNSEESHDPSYTGRNVEIGIPPCGLFKDDKVEMVMTVTFTKESIKQQMLFNAVSKGFTEALWGATKSTNDNNSPGTSKVLQNIISGMAISPDLSQPPSAVRAYDFSNLFDHSLARFTWAFAQVKLGPAYHAYEMLGYFDGIKTVPGLLENTYSSDSVAASRQNIMSLLKSGFDDALPAIDEQQMAAIMKQGRSYFSAAPVLCGIGQVPQYSTDTQ